MTDAALERRYRRRLRWYPREFRREHEEEMLGVLMAGAREERRRSELIECLDLLRGAVCVRLRPRVARSNQAVLNAIKLLYFGAVVELATAIMIVATIGDVKATLIKRNPGYSEVQWHAEVAGNFEPLVVATCIAVGFWLWMAWSIGRGHRWARIAFALFFGLNTYSLFNGLAGGSAVYARPDLAIASLLWLVELVATVLIFQIKSAGSSSGARGIAAGG